MKLFLLSLLMTGVIGVHAQQRCSPEPNTAPHKTAAGSIAGIMPAGPALSGIEGAALKGVVRIPVVVHVLFQNALQNISDAQIKSGIEALNRDFRRLNADTVQTPASFRNLAADMEVEFVLATTDPQGRPTNGIVRKPTAVKDWGADDKIKFSNKGGDDAWDSHSYYNIWIGNMSRSLGYASSPGGNPLTDGVVVTTSAFGTLNKSGPYNLGRTLVHETGHWLGLKHIWGDAACGDDDVADTPQQAGFTSGCPSGVLRTCSSAAGDMYMNYMDFTNDGCMNLFTQGQKEKVRQVLAPGRERSRLLLSKGLGKPWSFGQAEAVPALKVETPEAAVQTYPNPAGDYVMVAAGAKWVGGQAKVMSLSGMVLLQARINSPTQRIGLQGLKPGVYLLVLVNGNGSFTTKLVRGRSAE